MTEPISPQGSAPASCSSPSSSAINFSGTHVLARVAKIGLAAELIGVVALGLYLLLFQR